MLEFRGKYKPQTIINQFEILKTDINTFYLSFLGILAVRMPINKHYHVSCFFVVFFVFFVVVFFFGGRMVVVVKRFRGV